MGLLDSLINALFAKKPDLMSTEGVSGIGQYGGFLPQLERSGDLSGINKYITYDNVVLNTSVVAAAVRHYHSMISGVGWSLKPGVGPNAQKYADRIEQMIKTELKQPWSRVVGTMGQFKWVGFSVQEWIAERMPDGFIGLTKFENRPQSTIEQWALEEQSGDVIGFLQRDPGSGQLFPLHRSKCAYIADLSITHMPDGVGMLRHVVEAQRQLKRLEQLEGWGYETDLRGIPIGRAPIGVLDELVRRKVISDAEKTAKLKGLTDFIQNHVKNPQLGILLDSTPYRDEGQAKSPSVLQQWGLEFAHHSGAGLAEIRTAINDKNREIARAIGFEHIMLGGSERGSNAQHVDKTAGVRETMNATCKTIGWQLDQDVIVPIFEHNAWDLNQRPSFLPDALQLRSVQEVVDALEGMARAGAVIIPGDEVVNQVRGMLHLIEQPKITPEIAGMLMNPTQSSPTPKRPTGGAP